MENIDWNKLWQDSRAKRSWQPKTQADWDQRAAGFAKRNIRSPYVLGFLDKAVVAPKETVLDVGAGPGTLAIPLAARAKAVTAIDFSSQMLNILQERMAEQGVTNIQTIEASWDDDWQAKGIKQHDLVVASRSLAVKDLKKALEKLNTFARKRVIIGDRVGCGPFDPAIFEAIGRSFEPGPDYIYTVNILYQMGIKARVDFIRSGGASIYSSRQEALAAWRWMLQDLSVEEEARYVSHMDSRLHQTAAESWQLKDQVQPRWAVIQWKTEENDS